MIELLIVVVVLAVLASVAVFALSGVTSSASVAACNADARTVSIAVAAYNAQTGGSVVATPTLLTSGPTPYLQSFPPQSSSYTISISSTGAVMVAAPPSAAPVAYTAATNSCGNAGSGGAAATIAASPVLVFDQPFHDSVPDGTGALSLPATPNAANAACLTAAGAGSVQILMTCPTNADVVGSGKLRLTANTGTVEGGVFASTSVSMSQGLDMVFNSYQYGSGFGGDGIAVVFSAVDPANPVPPSAFGQFGGSLGYSPNGAAGLPDGYLGMGLDAFGNFSNNTEGTGCTNPPNISSRMVGQVVVRGPGNGTSGYCPLLSSAATASSPALTLRAATRAASLVPVEVVLNPSSSSLTTPSGLVVPAGDFDISFTPVGGAVRSLVGVLPIVPSGLYPSSWIGASGIPKQLAFGWVAAAGGATDYHEIDGVQVSTLSS